LKEIDFRFLCLAAPSVPSSRSVHVCPIGLRVAALDIRALRVEAAEMAHGVEVAAGDL
jgi:hypothetical protein